MFEIIIAEEFKKRFDLLPILSTEKLGPPFEETWSFRIDRAYRVIFKFINKNKILLITCGHHSWIYKR
jgi:plasmid maintenance system killer protein